jgi:predicted permease
MTRLRHTALHLAVPILLAVLVRVGYEDREHAALAILCAMGAVASTVVGLAFSVIALRHRAKGERWSVLDWLANASFALGVLGGATLSVVGLIAASRSDDRPPARASVVIGIALAALALAAAGIAVVGRRYWTAKAPDGSDTIRYKP